ncbi:30S ribosomal protein S15 [Spiroplasma endosymbiont of Agriotes lineatus]|uniref:30S ribosomal protein S15 n=1 Tax=Spiroplasma endosymbiont of Agriotes lineatus TaxID=3077930 RepID=UPI0030D280F5
MAIISEDKKQIIAKFGRKEKDTGSAEVQIALLTADITNLTAHLKVHRKDVVTERSLVKKVSQRRNMLDYLRDHDINRYRKVIEQLKLRK